MDSCHHRRAFRVLADWTRFAAAVCRASHLELSMRGHVTRRVHHACAMMPTDRDMMISKFHPGMPIAGTVGSG